MDIGTAVLYDSQYYVIHEWNEGLNLAELERLPQDEDVETQRILVSTHLVVPIYKEPFNLYQEVLMVRGFRDNNIQDGTVCKVVEIDDNSTIKYGVEADEKFDWVYEYEITPYYRTRLTSRWT